MKKKIVAALMLATLMSITALVTAKPSDGLSVPTVSSAEVQMLTKEADHLKAMINDQQKQISQQQGMLQVLSKKGDGANTAVLTAVGVISASLIAGYFALKNQNNQAAQGRLLKAVELIMDSRSGYQADIRRQNLSVFLDAATKEHLKDIKSTFAGPEFTEIHIQLAEAMSSKAHSPKEALEIWQAVLQQKNVISKVKFPQ